MLGNKKIYLVALMLIVPALAALAQNDKLVDAYRMLERGQLDSAKTAIDQAIVHPETARNAQVWYVRGFVYKEIYKAREISNMGSQARDVAVESFRKSIELDSSKTNREENTKILVFLASKYYNDAASSLDRDKYPVSISNYGKYRQLMTVIEPGSDMKQQDIKYGLAIASVYTDIFNSDRKNNTRFFDLAKAEYNKILMLDPNNLSANYHMGILYYNQAVDIINQSDYDIDIVTLDQIQDNSIALFKQSLPFMEKAYQLDPNKRETLEGLTGIYFSLNEFEKSNEFKARLEEIKNQR